MCADFDFFSTICISWISMEIQTHQRRRKAKIAENKVKFCQGKWHLNDRCVHCQQSGNDERREVTVRGTITAKVNACGVG